MRSFFALLLLALPLLAAATTPLQGAASRSISRKANVHPLARSLVGRQLTACASSCSSTSDLSALGALASCSSSDINCVCTNAEQLSSTCLSCVLTAENLSPSDLATACAGGGSSGTSAATTGASSPTSSSSVGCATECSAASDQNGLTVITNCASTDNACVCNAAGTLSTTCLDCTLAAANITPDQWTADCSAISASSAATQTSTTGSSVTLGGQAPTTATQSTTSTSTTSTTSSTTTTSSAAATTTATHSGAGKVVVEGLVGLVFAAMIAVA
ncbi:hypothetical protein DACRYDRAFT_24308 [Dacryopinax primogenitus]|uniref:Extracellular membrane protein CFEM domain-containing protein n=1 Tax=Dacryopinax primogenitus (strain DJM 731) TaxID=1858805 RepID=M5FSD1_DACPD|nr:uncharacterized protein DACRYDRAFT_24308 [Dacryopinax primogenitus]EJT98733.1 hypothetical protein DACRYDRAFT_24308 [Dacryopinax primogenitus]